MIISRPEERPRPHGDGRSHAKAILFGEHSVVFGAPAVALPIRRLATTVQIRPRQAGEHLHVDSALYSGPLDEAPTSLQPVAAAVHASLAAVHAAPVALDVSIGSTIPHERGLGSSAAVAAAIVRAVADFAGHDLPPADVHELVQVAERVAHGSPSGLDAHAVLADGPILFQNAKVQALRAPDILRFVVADTGVRGSTSASVEAVRLRRVEDPARTDAIIAELADTATLGAEHLVKGDRARIGAQMNRAHQQLQLLGVSSPELDALIDVARRASASGAKLTGGGHGGCIIALADSESHAERLSDALRRGGAARTWTFTAGGS